MPVVLFLGVLADGMDDVLVLAVVTLVVFVLVGLRGGGFCGAMGLE